MIGIYLLIAVCVVMLSIMTLIHYNKRLPRWFCDHLGWHMKPRRIKSERYVTYGMCPRCRRKVIQNSRGEWK